MTDTYVNPDVDYEYGHILSKVILRMRSMRPQIDSSLPYTVFSTDRMLQIWINTPACRFGIAGKCSVCDYWDGITSQDAVDKACEYIEQYGSNYEILLLNTCGSCLCEEELSFDNLMQVMNAVAKTKIKRIILESHLAYVSVEKLNKIKATMPDKEFIVEYGQESVSPYVLKYCLNKPSMISEYEVIAELQKNGIGVIANVLLGAPFLSVHQRIEDAAFGIQELLEKGLDGIVLFPVNIKPYTLVKYLFDNGYYKRVNAAEIVKVLIRFAPEELERIGLAWFEMNMEHQSAYKEQILPPEYCGQCGQKLYGRLTDYMGTESGTERKKILCLAEKELCGCADSLYEYPYPDINAAYKFLIDNVYKGENYAVDRCTHSY